MTTTESLPQSDREVSLSLRQRTARSLVLRRLAGIRTGRLIVEDAATGTAHELGPGEAETVRVMVRHPAFYPAIALRGALGAAEAYMDGHWAADDLVGVVRLLLRNRSVLEGMDGGFARLTRPARGLWHALRRNSRRGSRYNIAAHYDLGNDFFARFLDDTLTYSCAIFDHPESTLRSAQIAKLERLCQKLELGPDDHLLEIGTGWGSMALHAASRYGCRVTTTTISRQQHAVACERIAAAGLEDRVTVLLEDYRDLRGSFDKLVSVEMIEAVGHQYLDRYLRQCSSLLKPGGTMALQAITIADQHYQSALRRVDFIKRYVFPGSFIPSVTAIVTAMTRSSDLRLHHLEDFGPHYARTLWHWRHNLLGNRGAIDYPDDFLRMWEFYLAYCEGGFAERYLGLAQMVCTKRAFGA